MNDIKVKNRRVNKKKALIMILLGITILGVINRTWAYVDEQIKIKAEQERLAEEKRKAEEEKKKLAQDIRKYIIEVVSENGGHLASNLGVVELTLALESVFDVNKDKIVWDVGHQTYIHKILNGRKEELKSIRKLNGIAGFPKTKESETDCFNTGHSSTSISAAMGMAKARDIKKEKHSVIAVIGDGALTGGMALEALNHIGSSRTNVIVVLNDNEMSISKNIGGINVCHI